MATSGTPSLPRATRWEILGARLRIWTLPRGVQQPPPVSWRAVAAGIAGLVVAAAVVIAVVAPAIDRAKGRSAAQARRADASFVRTERARLTAEQRAHPGRSVAAARLHAAGSDDAARAALLADARADVGADVRARVAGGQLAGPIRDVGCGYAPPTAGPRLHLQCLAVTANILRDPAQIRGHSGHVFLVSGSLHDGRYVWCKVNSPPAEGSTGTNVFVPPPAACRR